MTPLVEKQEHARSQLLCNPRRYVPHVARRVHDPPDAVAPGLVGGGAEEVRSQTYRLWGNREWVKVLTSQVALDWVRRYLLGLDPLESNFNRRVPRRA